MNVTPTYVVTGGAGFIGSALIRQLIAETNAHIVNIDILTYAGDNARLAAIQNNDRYRFAPMDIGDRSAVLQLLEQVRPHGIFHLAAESHVDRSIDGPMQFAVTNTLGTLTLLDASLQYWRSLPLADQKVFRFVNISTDEVYGSLGATGKFTEQSSFAPRSPYSASKAGADHFAAAYYETFGLPVITTHASNNYGPFQFPEKLLPLALTKALSGESVPLYGDGMNVRDWLHVDDHARGLQLVMQQGKPGETYLMGGNNERTNRDVIDLLLSTLNVAKPGKHDYRELITYVRDRPGHDLRYAVDSTKINKQLGWVTRIDFKAGIESTVNWYLENEDWLAQVRANRYDTGRLGTGQAAVKQ